MPVLIAVGLFFFIVGLFAALTPARRRNRRDLTEWRAVQAETRARNEALKDRAAYQAWLEKRYNPPKDQP